MNLDSNAVAVAVVVGLIGLVVAVVAGRAGRDHGSRPPSGLRAVIDRSIGRYLLRSVAGTFSVELTVTNASGSDSRADDFTVAP